MRTARSSSVVGARIRASGHFRRWGVASGASMVTSMMFASALTLLLSGCVRAVRSFLSASSAAFASGDTLEPALAPTELLGQPISARLLECHRRFWTLVDLDKRVAQSVVILRQLCENIM